MSGPIFNLARKTVALLPTTWPAKIYNVLIKVPLLKQPLSAVIQKMTPEFMDIEEGRIIFDKEDPVMSGSLSLGEYEPQTLSLFRSILKPGMTVIDVGANLGYFTVIAASRVGPSGKVHSFEPYPHNYSLLQKNIATNDLKNVTAVRTALSDKAGTRDLFFGDNQCTHSFSDKRGAGQSEIVPTETLDNYLRSVGNPKIDIIKIDIEGAEPIVVDGMKETLSKSSSLIMLVEFYPNAIKRLGYSPLGFLETLKSYGFALSAIDEDRRMQTPINDLKAFADSFGAKDATRNLLAIKNFSGLPLASYAPPCPSYRSSSISCRCRMGTGRSCLAPSLNGQKADQ